MTRTASAALARVLMLAFIPGLAGACGESAAPPVLAQEVVAIAGGSTPSFWTYDIETDAWIALADAPANVGPGGALAQLQAQGFVYLLRGGGTAEFYRYELNTGIWSQLAAAPGAVAEGGALAGVNAGATRALYALQGGGFTNLWKYDITSNVWTTVAQVPVPVHDGGAITATNLDGMLDVLAGGGTTTVYKVDVMSGTWSTLGTAPGPVGPGGSLSNLAFSCDYALDGNTDFFSTGATCASPEQLPATPAAIAAGAAVAAPPAIVGANVDLIFAVRGGATTDFWQYSISGKAWEAMAPTPGPVSAGGALVQVRPQT